MRRVRRQGPAGVVVAALVLTVSGSTISAGEAAAATDRPGTLAAARTAKAIPQGTWVRNTISSRGDVDWYRVTLTASRRALITLGSLPADYELALFRADGRHVVTSSHGGRRFESLSVRLPKGDSFLRVRSTSGYDAGDSYVLRYRTPRAGVSTMSLRAIRSDTSVQVLGEFFNNSTSWQGVSEFQVEMINSSGKVIRRWTGGIAGDAIPPYGRTYFSSVETGLSAKAVRTATFRVIPEGYVVPTPSPRPPLTVKRLRTKVDGYYSVHHFTVSTTSTKRVGEVWVYGLVYDAVGRLSYWDVTIIENLKAKGSATDLVITETARSPRVTILRAIAPVNAV